VDEIGFDTIERSVVDEIRELFFFLLFRLRCVDVFLSEVPALKPGLGARVDVAHVWRVGNLLLLVGAFGS